MQHLSQDRIDVVAAVAVAVVTVAGIGHCQETDKPFLGQMVRRTVGSPNPNTLVGRTSPDVDFFPLWELHVISTSFGI